MTHLYFSRSSYTFVIWGLSITCREFKALFMHAVLFATQLSRLALGALYVLLASIFSWSKCSVVYCLTFLFDTSLVLDFVQCCWRGEDHSGAVADSGGATGKEGLATATDSAAANNL